MYESKNHKNHPLSRMHSANPRPHQQQHAYMHCTLLQISVNNVQSLIHVHVYVQVTALGVLCCFALFVCLILLAFFFLPSHLSFKKHVQVSRPQSSVDGMWSVGPGLCHATCTCVIVYTRAHHQLPQCIVYCLLNRVTASTKMNDASSRSHAIFTITFTQVHKDMYTCSLQCFVCTCVCVCMCVCAHMRRCAAEYISMHVCGLPQLHIIIYMYMYIIHVHMYMYIQTSALEQY